MAIIRNQPEVKVQYSEHLIQRAIISNFRNGCRFMVPNLQNRYGEMDMLIVRRSGYAEEFEVKISTSDFRADAKKELKHLAYRQEYEDDNLFKANALQTIRLPNRFSYIAPPGIIPLDEVPEYAGLYEVTHTAGRWWDIKAVKSPPLLHKQKLEWIEQIAVSCHWRLLQARKLIG